MQPFNNNAGLTQHACVLKWLWARLPCCPVREKIKRQDYFVAAFTCWRGSGKPLYILLGKAGVKACSTESWYTHAISLLLLDFNAYGFYSPKVDWYCVQMWNNCIKVACIIELRSFVVQSLILTSSFRASGTYLMVSLKYKFTWGWREAQLSRHMALHLI